MIINLTLEFTPTIVRGIAQEFRAVISICPLLTQGSGGIIVTAQPANIRNPNAATAFQANVPVPGTVGAALHSSNRSIIYAIEYPQIGLEVKAGSALAVVLGTPLQGAYSLTSTIEFEEL